MTDFEELLQEIEVEAKAEGSVAEAELAAFRDEFSMASQLIAWRKGARLTQQRLAALSGIAQSEISRIETGAANPTFSTLSAIARALGGRVGLLGPDELRPAPDLRPARATRVRPSRQSSAAHKTATKGSGRVGSNPSTGRLATRASNRGAVNAASGRMKTTSAANSSARSAKQRSSRASGKTRPSS
jgi:transcriptional regulator with XRE-family HTH domain